MGGFFAEAIETLSTGYRLDPELRLDFDFHLGRAYGSLGYSEQAIEWYQQSVNRDPHPVTFANIAETHFQAENYDDAYVNWRRSSELDPEHPTALEGIEKLKRLFFRQRVAALDQSLKQASARPDDSSSDCCEVE